ncbi:MAG: dTDP-4-dehydrorhamnose reductase [Deltaproteobacteria bacterium]|nr:dTDP-4-dehydrorhamnose reductase [Deltaproteobacteria bacterium]
MKVLVTGSKGQVGRELQNRGAEKGLTMIGVDIEEIDITDMRAVARLVEASAPDLVVNAAAYTAVDLAESNRKIAFQVNRDGPANIAAACATAGVPLIHISTDYVYGGDKEGAYTEDDPMAPLGVYAESKAAGDRQVADILRAHVIVRTAWVYSVHGHNFVKTMLRLGRDRERLTVVDDQEGCPTDAADLAAAILDIVGSFQREGDAPWGTYHYCGGGHTTWHGFASMVFEIAARYETFNVRSIQPVPTSAYPTPAKRPANSVLDCSKIKAAFGIVPPPWEKSLAGMLDRLYRRKGVAE